MDSNCAALIVPAQQMGRPRMALDRSASGMTLVEVMVAVAVLTISLIGTMAAISWMRMENRTASQRLLVASIGAEMIDLFKSLQYTDIHNSTAGVPIYLKGFGSASPNLAWVVPQAGQWQSLPVEAVNSSSASAPNLVPDKIPQGQWKVEFVPDAVIPQLQQINITIQWQLYAGSTRPPLSYAISTRVCGDFPKL
ncbi:MAG TPA: prepilin-type N-terminal cleavage/methylation domain-containing protein [Chthoniobacterales bacterium]|jgi:prepilin-type N-terminal cleavage/methylation domain-containing protein|nr:prepilin-type N-terminal cleavage/methylation domain-containing protein [Chthoniobacterales bacterium]